MKQLQNNFTTPEQSKRLLELGVPADSADCFYSEGADIKDGEVYFEYNTEPEILPKSAITGEIILFSEYKNKYTGGYVLPCWSVGRLMEIFDICNLYDLHKFSTRDWSINIKKLMKDYEVAVQEEMIDFSKLEE